jgi:putative hydrolase of the HAD superfamily
VGGNVIDAVLFELALAEVGVAPERALFVGDRRVQDVLGARRLDMRTVQALWFRDDDDPDGADPDFEARRIEDVLAIVDGLRAAS